MWKVNPKFLCVRHLLGEHKELHMLVGTLNKGIIDIVRSKYVTQGLIEIHNIKQLFDEQILPSAMWLITMALDNGTNGLNLSCF